MNNGIPAMWMRGGTSKGGYFLADDLPSDPQERDTLLLRIMGSPDPRQIDGLGGAVPVTSKVAIVCRSSEPGIDVDYLFLQVFVDQALVSDAQTCGNILAGVGPFAIERGLVMTTGDETTVRIRNTNTGQSVSARVQTPNGHVTYEGASAIDGVPGTAAPIPLLFSGLAGSKCGALLPTGNAVDVIDGLRCSLIDNGMPTILIAAADQGLSGGEAPDDLEGNEPLKQRLEDIRLLAGPMMALGDVTAQSVPKICLVSPPGQGGVINTRCFIPHSVHRTIGVLCAVSVATACLLEDGPARDVAEIRSGEELDIEHPGGTMSIVLKRNNDGVVTEAGNCRTARKLFDGLVFA
ncbi:MAG: 4-oxalomesaconate tautomerase [Alphaproteobacteria bacterium]|nr:4-oxalomesaconate tautomerase [Alphaproteobacteria bacterium]